MLVNTIRVFKLHIYIPTPSMWHGGRGVGRNDQLPINIYIYIYIYIYNAHTTQLETRVCEGDECYEELYGIIT